MNKPLVSIIVPVYNSDIYLSQCMDSLTFQTYKNIEIICVNDGSTDNSLDVLKRYAKFDQRIIIYTTNNKGVSAARNYALEASNGDYVAFVDADDWIERDTIEKAVKVIESYSADVIMWGYVSEHESKSEKRHLFDRSRKFDEHEIREKLHRRLVGTTGIELQKPEMADSLCPVWGKLYSKMVLENITFVSLEKIGSYEDGLFNLETFGRVKSVYYLDELLYHYRRSNITSQTTMYRPNLYLQWQDLYRLLNNYIEVNHLGQEYYDALNNRISFGILGLGINVLLSPDSPKDKIVEIRNIIKSDQYKKASKHLKLNFFPLHWKIFYFCSKHGFAIPLYVMLKVIRKVITS